MITRKNFLTMGVTMFVLLFLFQFSQIMKESEMNMTSITMLQMPAWTGKMPGRKALRRKC